MFPVWESRPQGASQGLDEASVPRHAGYALRTLPRESAKGSVERRKSPEEVVINLPHFATARFYCCNGTGTGTGAKTTALGRVKKRNNPGRRA